MRFILFFLIVFASNSMKSQTFVNDSIFEQMLIDLGYDDSLDNILINSIIDTIDTLNISGNNFDIIHDLSAIEGFSNLKFLDCSNHRLDTLDLNKNIYLKHVICRNDSLNVLLVDSLSSLVKLECSYNYLSDLDLSGNPALDSLDCTRNELNSIDLSENKYLSYLYCGSNNLNSLDLSNMVMGGVYSLLCENNAINYIDLEANSNLNWLSCYNNDLATINLDDCINLEILNLGNVFSQPSNYYNDFSTLDLTYNCNISTFYSANLPNLSCIQVCNVVQTNNWNLTIDNHHYFNLNCNFTSVEEFSCKDNISTRIDIYGRKSKLNYNTLLFFLHENGKVEKRFVVE